MLPWSWSRSIQIPFIKCYSFTYLSLIKTYLRFLPLYLSINSPNKHILSHYPTPFWAKRFSDEQNWQGPWPDGAQSQRVISKQNATHEGIGTSKSRICLSIFCFKTNLQECSVCMQQETSIALFCAMKVTTSRTLFVKTFTLYMPGTIQEFYQSACLKTDVYNILAPKNCNSFYLYLIAFSVHQTISFQALNLHPYIIYSTHKSCLILFLKRVIKTLWYKL